MLQRLSINILKKEQLESIPFFLTSSLALNYQLPNT